LTGLNAQLRVARLTVAVGYWHDRGRCAGWQPPRRPRLRRLVDTALVLAVGLAGQAVTLFVGGGRLAVAGYLGWFFVWLVVTVLISRRLVGFLVSTFVIGPLSDLILPSVSVAGAALISGVGLAGTAAREARTAGVPVAVWLPLGLATAFGPLLIAALSVRAGWLAKRLPSTRARVIERIERAAGRREKPGPDRLRSSGQRLVEAGRRVRGSSLPGTELGESEVFLG